MKIRSPVITAFAALIAVYLLNGCIAVKVESTHGSALDTKQIDSIKPGITKFSDILEWFGPPDFIIDGTQQIVDFERSSGMVYGSISTRTLTAPDEMVILIYTLSSTQEIAITGVAVGAAVIHVENEIRPNEAFIFLSKKDHTVLSVVAGIDSE